MEGLILLMTNSAQIYLDNEVLHPLINDFLRNIFMSFLYCEIDKERDLFISVDEGYSTWRVCEEYEDKVELEFEIFFRETPLADFPPVYGVLASKIFLKIHVENKYYDELYEIEKSKAWLCPNDYSMYQKLLCIMIEQKTPLNIKIKYPYESFNRFKFHSFKNNKRYNEYFKNSLHYFKLIDENVIGHVQIDIEGDKITSTNIIELKKINSSFYYPSEINLFFDKDYENAETLFLYYCALLRIFYKIEIDAIELRGNFSQMITEIEKTIILLKY